MNASGLPPVGGPGQEAAAPPPGASESRPPAGSTGQASLDRIATFPNLLSAIRILLIPAFVLLLLHHGTEGAGLILLAGVVSTDWVDGLIARRTGQVSNLGKVLDPVADRLALASALVTLVVRHAFPLWAALLIIVRDAVNLTVGGLLLVWIGVRLDVRWIGKIATAALMCGIPLIAWAHFGLALHGPARVLGWIAVWIGLVLYYASAAVYAADVARAIRHARADRGASPAAERA